VLRLSRKTDYAFLLVTALARRWREMPRAFSSVRELVREYRLPYRFTASILSTLTHAHILESREGTRGGFRLAREPQVISLTDVLRATEGSSPLVACLDARTNFACVQKSVCPARHGMPAIQRLLHDTLARYTVADLVTASLPPRPHVT